MIVHQHLNLGVFLAGILLVAACGNRSGGGAEADAESLNCRDKPAAELSPFEHGCALAAEMRAIGEALASVTDQESADQAALLLRKSSERLKALKTERLKLNDDPQAGAKGAMVGVHAPAMSAASRKVVNEFTRITRLPPPIFQTINSAMEGIEF